MTRITFVPSSPIVERETTGPIFFSRRSDGSGRLNKLFASPFDREFRNLDRQMRKMDREIHRHMRSIFRNSPSSSTRDPDSRFKVRFLLIPIQTKKVHSAPDEPLVSPMKGKKENPKNSSTVFMSALVVAGISALVLGSGYLAYQNAEPIGDLLSSVSDSISNAGQGALDTLKNAWDKTACRFSYQGCTV